MDVGHLPVFVGTGATPPDDAAAFTAPAGDAAERGFVSALAEALGEDDEVPGAARSRGGGATPRLPTDHMLSPEPGWPLLAAMFGSPGGDLESLGGPLAPAGDEATGPEGDVPDSPEGAAVPLASQPLSGSINGLLAASGPDDNGTPARGEADALPPRLDRLLSYPPSDQRSPQGRRAATGQPVAEPEPAGDVGDHGPLADAGRADDGKLMSRALFGGAEQGEPLTQGVEGDGRTPRALQAPPRAPGAPVRDDTTLTLPTTPAPGPMRPVTGSPGVGSPAGAGRSHGVPADPAALSLRASELATLANRGPLVPSKPPAADAAAQGQRPKAAPAEPFADATFASAARPDPLAPVAPFPSTPQGSPAAVFHTGAETGTAIPAAPPMPKSQPADRRADDLVGRVAVVERNLAGVAASTPPTGLAPVLAPSSETRAAIPAAPPMPESQPADQRADDLVGRAAVVERNLAGVAASTPPTGLAPTLAPISETRAAIPPTPLMPKSQPADRRADDLVERVAVVGRNLAGVAASTPPTGLASTLAPSSETRAAIPAAPPMPKSQPADQRAHDLVGRVAVVERNLAGVAASTPQAGPAPILAANAEARGAYLAGPLPDFPAADRWADELAQQVAVAGRVLPGVAPRSAPDTAAGGRDSSPGRQAFGRSLADSAALSLAAFGRQSAAEFAAAMSRQPGAPAGLDQAAAEPTADGQPLAHAIVRSLSVQVRQGGGEARLRLQPEYLGELSLSLRVQASSVTVVLRSESPIVRGWIESHQADLRRALEAQGLVLDRIVVDPDADPRQSNHESSPDAQSQPRRRRSPEPGRFEALL